MRRIDLDSFYMHVRVIGSQGQSRIKVKEVLLDKTNEHLSKLTKARGSPSQHRALKLQSFCNHPVLNSNSLQ